MDKWCVPGNCLDGKCCGGGGRRRAREGAGTAGRHGKEGGFDCEWNFDLYHKRWRSSTSLFTDRQSCFSASAALLAFHSLRARPPLGYMHHTPDRGWQAARRQGLTEGRAAPRMPNLRANMQIAVPSSQKKFLNEILTPFSVRFYQSFFCILKMLQDAEENVSQYLPYFLNLISIVIGFYPFCRGKRVNGDLSSLSSRSKRR